MREHGQAGNDLFDRLAGDARLGLTRADIDALVADRSGFVGMAPAQVGAVVDRIAAIVELHPDAGAYQPAPIL